jgi:hypothetical protein
VVISSILAVNWPICEFLRLMGYFYTKKKFKEGAGEAKDRFPFVNLESLESLESGGHFGACFNLFGGVLAEL